MNTTNDRSALEPLQRLGFTEIESLVYTYLLQHEPSTGYRVSHAIGKPTANTYKAIASLEQRGALQVEDGDSRLVRAVSPEELLAQMERRFLRDRSRAEEALGELQRDHADDRIYALKSVDQVMERARAMLERARTIVLLDVFPRALDEIANDLEPVVARGVQVVAKTYAPIAVPGLGTTTPSNAREIVRLWPGEQLSLVVDAEEHLLALLARDLRGVHQAIWSNSTYLSCMHHNHLAADIGFTEMRRAASDSRPTVDNRAASAGRSALTSPPESVSLLNTRPPGYRRLLERCGEGDAGAEEPPRPASPSYS